MDVAYLATTAASVSQNTTCQELLGNTWLIGMLVEGDYYRIQTVAYMTVELSVPVSVGGGDGRDWGLADHTIVTLPAFAD